MYESVHDETLLMLVAQGSLTAYRALFERYKTDAKKISFHMLDQKSCRHISIDDCILIFYESFSRTISNYLYGTIPLKYYFRKVFIRELNAFLNSEIAPSELLHGSISLDECYQNSDSPFINCVDDKSVGTPAELFNVDRALIELQENDDDNKKVKLHKRVIILRSAGYTYDEIAKFMKVKVGVVRRILDGKNENGLLYKMSIHLR